MEEKLLEFVDFLEDQIMKKLTDDINIANPTQGVINVSVAQAYERDKNAILNIINGRRFCDCE